MVRKIHPLMTIGVSVFLFLCAAPAFGIPFNGIDVITEQPSDVTLNGEYSIEVMTEQLNIDSWLFTYEITNNNQQIEDTMTGLDGFVISLPESAIVSNVTVPEPYFTDVEWPYEPWWDYNLDNNSLSWWGYGVPSVYPVDMTATFSFEASNVSLGITDASVASYWSLNDPPSDYPHWVGYTDAKYTTFDTTLMGPAAVAPVPEPASLLLLGCGLIGLSRLKRKFG